MSDDTVFVGGSGNVFADAGLPDAEERHLKSQLASAILDAIEERELSQRAAATRTGVSQADVSNITRGRVRGFSTDRLLAMLVALGRDVDIRIRPVAAGAHGSVVVVQEAATGGPVAD